MIGFYKKKSSNWIPIQPTLPCKYCGSVDFWTADYLLEDFYCLGFACAAKNDNIFYKTQYQAELPLGNTCKHEKGSYPLKNPKKNNRMFIICKKCGEDLEEHK